MKIFNTITIFLVAVLVFVAVYQEIRINNLVNKNENDWTIKVRDPQSLCNNLGDNCTVITSADDLDKNIWELSDKLDSLTKYLNITYVEENSIEAHYEKKVPCSADEIYSNH